MKVRGLPLSSFSNNRKPLTFTFEITLRTAFKVTGPSYRILYYITNNKLT